MVKVYVAAPYLKAEAARLVHRILEHYGFGWTSTWAEDARGPDNHAELAEADRERLRLRNQRAIEEADAVLVLGAANMCESLVEVGYAIARAVPVVWVEGGQRLPLSATCPGVCTRVPVIVDAMGALAEITRRAA